MRAEELVLGLSLDSPEGLDGSVVEVGSTDIRVAFMAAPQVLFEQQVVCSGDMVVFVGLYAPTAVL